MNQQVHLVEFHEVMDLIDRTRRRLLSDIHVYALENPIILAAEEKMTSEKVREICDRADRARNIREKVEAEKQCREAQLKYAEGR